MVRHPRMIQPRFGERERLCAERLIELAREEDLGREGDLTAQATIPSRAFGQADFVARQAGIICGLPIVSLVAHQFGLAHGFSAQVEDGAEVKPGQILARIQGPMRDLLAMERPALNFLQRLSGIASLTAKFVAVTEGTPAEIYDTRKTTPGWRALEKYAVRCGGGQNHRFGLNDAVLIKDNHLAWLKADGCEDPIRATVEAAKSHVNAEVVIQVEVDDLDQFDQALAAQPSIILLDNFEISTLIEAVSRRDRSDFPVILEASGGINLSTLALVATTGVERISVGALTHSAQALDVGLDYGSVTFKD